MSGDGQLNIVDSCSQLVKRAYAILPDILPSSNPDDYEILADLEGIRPLRAPEVRVKSKINHQWTNGRSYLRH